MKNSFFIISFIGRVLVLSVPLIALLILGVSQGEAQGPPDRLFDVTNMHCGLIIGDGDNGNGEPHFEVVGVSSTDQCVLNDVQPGRDCAEALQFIMGSRRFSIEAGGGGTAQGISEALVTTAGGIMYTLTRRPGPSRRDRLEECVVN